MDLEDGWRVTLANRRWSENELSGPSFDGKGEKCFRRVFVFASPRSASWTACRYLVAAGWGIPCEYFSYGIAEFYFRMSGGAKKSLAFSELREYRQLLEECRSRNGVFSTKVFWTEFTRLQDAYTPEQLDQSVHIYWYRRDFASQIVSLQVARAENQFSFTSLERDYGVQENTTDYEEEEKAIKQLSGFLLASEHAWFMEFGRRGWKPLVIESEQMLHDPVTTMKFLSSEAKLPIDCENIARCYQHEVEGRYEVSVARKRAFHSRHSKLLSEVSQHRQLQLEELLATTPHVMTTSHIASYL